MVGQCFNVIQFWKNLSLISNRTFIIMGICSAVKDAISTVAMVDFTNSGTFCNLFLTSNRYYVNWYHIR